MRLNLKRFYKLNLKRYVPRIPLIRLNKHTLLIAIIAVGGFFSVLLVIKAVDLLATVIFTPSAAAKAIEKATPKPEDIAKRLEVVKKHTEELKRKNYFCPIPVIPPVVNGILGDKALISGRWCGVGETVNDAKVKSISVVEVVLEWQGKELRLSPLPAMMSTPGAMPPGAMGTPPSRPGAGTPPQMGFDKGQRKVIINK
jgi:hypothetical protein